jgi:prepilin-type processing-associated H-X9-DG protein
MYTDDEEGTLPGPVYTGVHASYDNSGSSQKQLVWFLATYLGYPRPSGQMVAAEVFMCPGFRRDRGVTPPYSGIKCYLLSGTLTSPPVPFGIPEPPSLYQRPMKLAELEKYGIPAGMPVLTDLDLVNVSTPPSGWGPIDLPPVPVHGSVRNTLFFDWHVQTTRAW